MTGRANALPLVRGAELVIDRGSCIWSEYPPEVISPVKYRCLAQLFNADEWNPARIVLQLRRHLLDQGYSWTLLSSVVFQRRLARGPESAIRAEASMASRTRLWARSAADAPS